MNIQGSHHVSPGTAAGGTTWQLTQAETREWVAACDHDRELARAVAAVCSLRLYERPVAQVSPSRPAASAGTAAPSTVPSRSQYFEKYDLALYRKAMQGQEPAPR